MGLTLQEAEQLLDCETGAIAKFETTRLSDIPCNLLYSIVRLYGIPTKEIYREIERIFPECRHMH